MLGCYQTNEQMFPQNLADNSQDVYDKETVVRVPNTIKETRVRLLITTSGMSPLTCFSKRVFYFKIKKRRRIPALFIIKFFPTFSFSP